MSVSGGAGMGNVLESDVSVNLATLASIEKEVRTEGDGMESQFSTDSNQNLGYISPGFDKPKPSLIVNATLKKQPDFDNAMETFSVKGQKSQVAKRAIVSPRELPSRDKLIPLKPTKLIDVTSKTHSSYVQFTAISVGKQKNPKFIPYEPYSGATRSMTEGNIPGTQSQKPSTFIISTSSIVPNEPYVGPLAPCLKIENVDLSPSKSKGANPLTGEASNSVHSHSTTLLKERLKMAEKDINELQGENSRLKRLLVDSLSGSGPRVLADEMRCASFNLKCQSDSSGNTHSISESFDNLSDEIEVWRSKFLSSCVLVEQLTKENQGLKESSVQAMLIFRELKNSTSLAPDVFDLINTWLNKNSTLINSNSLVETDSL